eukprot:47639-Rhodomonas_salina.1
MLLEQLTDAVERHSLRNLADLTAITDFASAIVFGVPRALEEHGKVLGALAKALVSRIMADPRDPSTRAAALCATRLRELTFGSVHSEICINERQAQHAQAASARIASKDRWPGGRHSNDRHDFRDIAIVPTIDELLASDLPFLPAADSDFLANDPQSQYLDRHFRLLREDLTSSLREALAEGEGFSICLHVEVEDVELHEYITPDNRVRVNSKHLIQPMFDEH